CYYLSPVINPPSLHDALPISDDDAVEVLAHVELPVHRLDPRRVFEAEVVGQEPQRLDAPSPLFLQRREQLPVLLFGAQLRPRLSEEVEQPLRCPLVAGQVEQALQRQMSGRAPRLVWSDRLGEPVDRPELEELRAGLEIARPA